MEMKNAVKQTSRAKKRCDMLKAYFLCRELGDSCGCVINIFQT